MEVRLTGTLIVEWGDGGQNSYYFSDPNDINFTNLTHTYSSFGKYKVKFTFNSTVQGNNGGALASMDVKVSSCGYHVSKEKDSPIYVAGNLGYKLYTKTWISFVHNFARSEKTKVGCYTQAYRRNDKGKWVSWIPQAIYAHYYVQRRDDICQATSNGQGSRWVAQCCEAVTENTYDGWSGWDPIPTVHNVYIQNTSDTRTYSHLLGYCQ